MITPGYFDTFGIRMLRGRDFTDLDGPDGLRVAIINRSMARLYFGDRDPLGQTIGFFSERDKRITVVGLVDDTHQMNLREKAPAIVYTPLAQEPESPSWMNFEMRTAQDPAALAAGGDRRRARRQQGRRDSLRADDGAAGECVADARAPAGDAVGGFAVLALILAAVGLYGVMSYSVSRRGREIGIRMALGARRGTVLWQVLRQTLVVSVIGIADWRERGVLVSARYVSTLLFGLSERDPVTLAERRTDAVVHGDDRGLLSRAPRRLSGSGHRHQVGIGRQARARCA